MLRNLFPIVVALLVVAWAGSCDAKKPARLYRYISVVRFNATDNVKYVFDSYNVVKKACVKETNITRVFSGMDMDLDPAAHNYGVIFVMDFKRTEDAMPYIICMRDSPLMPREVANVGRLENAAGYTSGYNVKMPYENEIVEVYLYNYNASADQKAAEEAVNAGVLSTLEETKTMMIRKREYHGPTMNELTAALYFPPTGYYGSASFKSLKQFKEYNETMMANVLLSDAKKKYVVAGGRMQFRPYIIKK